MRFGVLSAMTGWQTVWALLAIAVCGLIILVILLQRGRGGGLSGAFGGGGSSSAFGAKTGDVFTVVTVVLATLFLAWFVVGNYVFIPGGSVVATAPAVSGAGTAPDDSLPLPAAGDVNDPAAESQDGAGDDEPPEADTSTPAGDAGEEQP